MRFTGRAVAVVILSLGLIPAPAADVARSFEKGAHERDRDGLLGGGAIAAPFDTDYTFVELGAAPNVPAPYAAVGFAPGDPDTLWLGGNGGGSGGAVYAIAVTRDGDGHITGFQGSAVRVLEAPSIDGGLTIGPDDVVFYSRVSNEIGQATAGSTTTDKVVDLGALGVAPSPGGLEFVPEGFAGAGSLKSLSWSGGEWNTLAIAADLAGTFDITGATQETTLSGGPEGFGFVPAGSPQFFDFSHVAVAEFTDASIVVYDLDGLGDPMPSTRQLLATGFTGAPVGLTFDPVTGDLIFSVFSLANPSVFAIRGFGGEGGGNGDDEKLCDGIDNDEDGKADEGFELDAPCTSGIGACAMDGLTVCAPDGLDVECDAIAGTPADDDATCDATDDDCDGENDEDFVGETVTCGVGACESEGLTFCVEGRLTERCEPGEPEDERCDNGIDDDCDGSIDQDDEDCIPGECVDEDGDGYGAFGDPSCPKGDRVDCDDADASVNPSAIDIPGNAVDENCDGEAACDACRAWKNHGQYVSCVAGSVNRLVARGALDRQEGSALVRAAAMSDIGKRGYRPEECVGNGPGFEPRRGARSLEKGR